MASRRLSRSSALIPSRRERSQASRSARPARTSSLPRSVRVTRTCRPSSGWAERRTSPASSSPVTMRVIVAGATGWTGSAVARAVLASEDLVLAEGTVKNHVSALLRKLEARDRTALALMLYKSLTGADEPGGNSPPR